jgi:hypothetical protein
MKPRIEPMRREDAAPEVAKLYDLMEKMGNPPPNMHLTFGKNPDLYAKWLPFATYIIPASSLAPRDRQILIPALSLQLALRLRLVAARAHLEAPIRAGRQRNRGPRRNGHPQLECQRSSVSPRLRRQRHRKPDRRRNLDHARAPLHGARTSRCRLHHRPIRPDRARLQCARSATRRRPIAARVGGSGHRLEMAGTPRTP